MATAISKTRKVRLHDVQPGSLAPLGRTGHYVALGWQPAADKRAGAGHARGASRMAASLARPASGSLGGCAIGGLGGNEWLGRPSPTARRRRGVT